MKRKIEKIQGQIAESEKVDNYPGFSEISGYDLGEKFREHALRLEVPFIEHEAVKIEKNQDKIWEVSLENKEKLYAKTGDIDILVLNASVQYKRKWDEFSLEEYDIQMDCNVKSSYLLIKK